MVSEVKEINVPNVYSEILIRLNLEGKVEKTRNGRALVFPDPVVVTILNPRERVLFDPVRDCNPFFHVMEFIWMMAGSKDVRWIEKFNKKYRDYADPGTHVVHGAYGYRWRDHFGTGVDQILEVIKLLKKDRTTRRAVLGMWDPSVDLEAEHADLPCNTHIYFRYHEDRGLCMTVCNRSNDIIWGMLGANAVHMTYLLELVAHGAGLPMGTYTVFSNNAHVYENIPQYEEIRVTRAPVDLYTTTRLRPQPLFGEHEYVEEFLEECEFMVRSPDKFYEYRNRWMNDVAQPMRLGYVEKEKRNEWLDEIEADDWRRACKDWVARRR